MGVMNLQNLCSVFAVYRFPLIPPMAWYPWVLDTGEYSDQRSQFPVLWLAKIIPVPALLLVVLKPCFCSHALGGYVWSRIDIKMFRVITSSVAREKREGWNDNEEEVLKYPSLTEWPQCDAFNLQSYQATDSKHHRQQSGVYVAVSMITRGL